MSLITAGQASASTQMRIGRYANTKKKPSEDGFEGLEPAPQGGGEGGWLGRVDTILGNDAAAVCRARRIRASGQRDRRFPYRPPWMPLGLDGVRPRFFTHPVI